MAPGPQELSAPLETRERGVAPLPADAVVISGMSGLLPGCHNVAEFADKLYAKENLVKKYEPGRKYQLADLPQYTGHVPGLDQFDAQFFMVHYRLCQTMDAMARKVLENSYQAIYDAGISPAELSSKRVAVFIAVGATETEKGATFAAVGMGLLGCNRTMIANRVSYWLNLKGPSLVVDASCCGALVAFEKGYHAIASGECDAAIVGASKLLLHPQTLIHYQRLVSNNKDGKTKCYDMNADGQTSSEAINVFLLQKYKDSKRVYASLCYAKSHFGVVNDEKYAEKYGPGGDPQSLAKFLREFYNDIGVAPSIVEYVEGFGAALPDIDKMELEAIEEVFCKDRANPLLLGSVMSNIGYTEAASGSSAIIKILLAYHRGELAASLHCENPRQDVAALREGRLRIVMDHQSFGDSYAAVNGLSVTGLHGHALLRGHYKPKDLSRYHSHIPYLVTVSGRQESAVQKIIDHLKSNKLDPEELALLHNIHKYRINGHMARGFGVLSSNKDNSTIVLREEVDYFDDATRPLWFVYSGMGSQWAGMGAQLMRIPVFAAAIERCHKVLEPKGVDIYHVLTSPDKNIFNNILNSFVGIAAVQIGLTDVLTSIGLVPDNIIGHSVGELGCAYADGCLTAEEMVLAAYSRGLVSLETRFIAGSMAAVGLGYTQISTMCPPEIEVACHNGPESCTISGPAAVMREFVAQLTAKGIFAKEVQCSNIAFHSRYIAKAGPGLLHYLSDTIKTPKLRSERWVSTSVPQNRWHEDEAKYSSAEYHTNNLLSPVLFEETARLVPSNAVVVEIAPHGLLQAILKRSLPPSCKNIALAVRYHPDNTLFLLEAIGKLYINGYVPDIAALYPQIEFPVSTGTPMLSHLTEWVYTENWKLCQYTSADRNHSASYKPIITIYDDEYLAGHIIEGTRYYPFAAILVSVWDTLAMTLSKPRRSLPAQFRDVHLHVQPRLLDHDALHLTVALQRGTGRFEVSYEHGLVAEGIIVSVSDTVANLDYNNDSLVLASNDIYKLLYERGYDYMGDFRSIHKANYSLDQAELVWKNNWVTLIDGLFQLNALRRSHDAISQLTHIKSLSVSPKLHFLSIRDGQGYIDAKLLNMQEITQCGGVTISKLTFVDKPFIGRCSPALKMLQFFPFFLQEKTDILTTLYVFMQIIAENVHNDHINIFDLICSNKPPILQSIEHLLISPPTIKHKITRIGKSELVKLKNMKPKPDVLIVHEQLVDKRMFETLYHCLPSNTFIVSIGIETEELYPAALYRPVCARGLGATKLELALWRPATYSSTTSLTVCNTSEIDFFQSTCSNLSPQHRIFVLSTNPPPAGLRDIIKQQKRDHNRKIYVAMINHKLADVQNLDHLPSLDLSYNILNHGKWGGEYYVPLPERLVTELPVALKSAQIGDIDSLNWVEVPAVSIEQIPVTVHYAAVNAYDAKRARSELPICNANEGFGMDFSGVTDSGERVFGIVRNEAVCARVSARPELLWPVPVHWDLEDAATVPLPYLQAFYCLAVKTQLREGMRVLIHGGAGALGQAAISIALSMRCEVFTTVSDVRKKNFLKQLFPNLKGNHIGNSRDSSFSHMVLCATKGAGCHIVINNLKGELKNASLNCCAAYGTTLDLIQIHTRENYSYGMYNMTKARSYVPIDCSAIIENNDLEELQHLKLLISEGIARGYVRPLSRVTYSPHEASRAFRLLAGSNHRGRVLLRIADVATAPLAQPRLACSSDMQQLLISDEEVLGLQLADRLINRGAKKLRLYFPRPSGYLNVKKAAWCQRGVQLDTTFGQIWNVEKLLDFLHDSQQKGNVESLFFIIRQFEHTSIVKSTLKSLDTASRELLPTLKYFTVISEGQHFGREICHDRALYGFRSLALQLQNMEQFDEIGFINSHAISNKKLKWKNAVEIIETAVCSKEPVVFGYAQPKTRRPLLEEVALIPGVSISSATDPRSTLEQVGIDQGRAQELCYLLEEKFNITLQKESLPHMTLVKLMKLEEKIDDSSKDEFGIRAYFKAIDPDELVATSEIVLMYTLGCSSDMFSDQFDASLTYLCIVPGVEGYHKRFDVLCERLKLPAVVLQPSVDVLDTNVQEMAQRLIKVMVQTLGLKKRFFLVGYELGILVALEMAAILESYGSVGTIYCLGGTPEDIRTSLETNLGTVSEETLQDSLVQYLTTLMMNADVSCLLQDLQKANALQDKIEICVKKIRGQVSYTSQFTRSYLMAAYNRIKLIRTHRAIPRTLRSKIVILRAILPWALNLDSLQGFSEQPLVVHELQASLAQAPNNLQCTAIINKHLDSDILETFDNRNLCDSYLISSDIFSK